METPQAQAARYRAAQYRAHADCMKRAAAVCWGRTERMLLLDVAAQYELLARLMEPPVDREQPLSAA